MDKFFKAASRTQVRYLLRATSYRNVRYPPTLPTNSVYRCCHDRRNADSKQLSKRIVGNDTNVSSFQNVLPSQLLSKDDRILRTEKEHNKVVAEMKQLDKRIRDIHEGSCFDMANEGLAKICDGYSKAHGSYITWETDVNLDPPKSWGKPAPEEDSYLLDYYNSLQYTLYETAHPETVDRTSVPRGHSNKEQVNVVLLSSPVECIGVLLEGGKQIPDGFHLVMSPSWLSKVQSADDPALSSLMMHKSISFHENGASYIDEYDPPRKVTYFVNYFTDTITSGHRNDGVDIEKNLDCPMSSSIKLCELVDDKVWTRDVMAEVGMEIPETLAIRREPIRKLSSATKKMAIMRFDCYKSLDMKDVGNEISAFAKRLQSLNIKTIVVKPSGPKYLGSVGISFHSTSNVTSIIDAADDLLQEIDEGSSVLVEEFIEPILPRNTGLTRISFIPQRAAACRELVCSIEENVTCFRYMEEHVICKPYLIGKHGIHLWSANDELGFRVRSTICRDHDGTPVTTLINCSVANKRLPINGDNTICQSLNSTLLAYNVLSEHERNELERTIRVQSADVLEKIIERENMLSDEEKGALRGQTDVIGIDMMVTEKAGKLVPVGIEVNSHDCTINTQLYDFMMNLGESMLVSNKTNSCPRPTEKKNEPELIPLISDIYIDGGGKSNERTEDHWQFKRKANLLESRYYLGNTVGQSVRPLVRNMIVRSQQYMVRGKQIVVIGGGGYSKRNIWKDAKRYGIHITLVDSDEDHLAKDLVHRFIHYEFDDHKKDFAHACNIYNILQAKDIHVDGCLTFWEDCVPLAALVKEMTGTKGSDYKAALTGKKKSRTQNVLNTRKGDIPHWPRTYLYSSQSVHIKSEDDSVLVPKDFKFPAILKLEHGSSAVGVSVVKNEDEIRKKYQDISELFRDESDFPGIGLGHDNTMVAMEYHKGSEHDVDVILYDRKLVGAFISDNGPTRYPYFTETAAVMPSCLPADKQAQLIAAAYQCCTEIGLSSGTFNVELLMTGTGPKLIEINARMGGFYLRDWIRDIYGVDLVLCSLMISCGLKPYIPKLPANKCIMGIMLIPSAHAHVLQEVQYKTQLNEMIEKNEIKFTQFGELGESTSSDYEEPFGNIAVGAETAEEAKENLIRICNKLEVIMDKYPVHTFLRYF